jgi:alkanesulfonate monooxygenase SsuD/methylene tetrahydromethanopterin reductase-like flavin-dependent oxidoreductase (luciferase family)
MSARSHPIRFGVFTGVAQTTWPDLLEVWQRADEMGFDTGWVPDHFYAGYGDPSGPCFEAGTVLAAVAARTRRIGIAARPPYDLGGLERFLTRVAARVRA